MTVQRACIGLLAVCLCSAVENGAVTGSDYDLSERLRTKRWINFHPNRAMFGETVAFTFKGFWANRESAFRVRLSKDEKCEEVPVVINGEQTTQEIRLVDRKATFLLPSNSSYDVNWMGGFCAEINERWHFIDNTLELADAYPPTSELMLGYQTCENYMYAQRKFISGICGCFLQIDLPYYKEQMERYYPVTIPTTFDNRDLLNQISTMNLVQGCCQRWTPIREAYDISKSNPPKTWGYCSEHHA
ncbi:hypothetical protein DIPPA_15909 [Diplonema papillatum]|nr:hypothetical protein DIPPA_15909 [Diplonema papillatum]|eukprot:gene16124-24699_t